MSIFRKEKKTIEDVCYENMVELKKANRGVCRGFENGCEKCKYFINLDDKMRKKQ